MLDRFGVAFYIYLIDVLFNNLEGNGTLQSPPGVVAACVWTIIYKTTNKGKTEAMISVKMIGKNRSLSNKT